MMDDDYVKINMANDDWNNGTGTYDELKMGDNREIGKGIVEKPGIENEDYDPNNDFKSILIDNDDKPSKITNK